MDDPLSLNQHTYVRLTARQAWDNLPLVVLAGGVFSLLCLPAFLFFFLGWLVPSVIVGAISVAPAWTALLAQEAEIVRGSKTSIGVMFRALSTYGARSAKLGLLITVPLLAGLLTLPSLALPEVPAVVWIGLAADVLGLLLLATLYLYAFPLLVLHDMGVSTALRNAFILAGRHIVNTLGLLSMDVLFVLATIYLSPGLLFIFPAVWGMFVVNNCRLVVAEERQNSPPGY